MPVLPPPPPPCPQHPAGRFARGLAARALQVKVFGGAGGASRRAGRRMAAVGTRRLGARHTAAAPQPLNRSCMRPPRDVPCTPPPPACPCQSALNSLEMARFTRRYPAVLDTLMRQMLALVHVGCARPAGGRSTPSAPHPAGHPLPTPPPNAPPSPPVHPHPIRCHRSLRRSWRKLRRSSSRSATSGASSRSRPSRRPTATPTRRSRWGGAKTLPSAHMRAPSRATSCSRS